MRKHVLVLAILALVFTVARTHAQGTGAKSDLDVDGVVAMVKAGLSDDLIIAKLHQQDRAIDLSTDQMIALKQAKVSDAVIRAMLDPRSAQVVHAPTTVISGSGLPILAGSRPSGATPEAGTGQIGDPNDPNSPHDSGIYVMTKDHEGKALMVLLERASYQGAKTGGLFATAMTYGIVKAKTHAEIPGPHASIRVNEASPTFYFYFDDKQAGLGKTYFGFNSLSNPNQFALLKLTAKKNSRETVIGTFSAWSVSSGTDQGAMIPFKSEKLRAGLYKVTAEGLKEGEYCFYASSGPAAAGPAAAAGATSSGGDIFDFGVSLK